MRHVLIYSRNDFKLQVDKFEKMAYVYVLNPNEEGVIEPELIGEWSLEKLWDSIYHPEHGRRNTPLIKVGDGRVDEWIYQVSQELEPGQEIEFDRKGGFHFEEIG